MYSALARVVTLCSKFRKINDGNLNNKALFIKRKILFFCHFFFYATSAARKAIVKRYMRNMYVRASCKSLQSERVFFFSDAKKFTGVLFKRFHRLQTRY